jgi:hypothetical protein
MAADQRSVAHGESEGAPSFPTARRGAAVGRRWLQVVAGEPRWSGGAGHWPVDRFVGGWLLQVRRCLYWRESEGVARWINVNIYHRRSAPHLAKEGLRPSVGSSLPHAHLPPARHCVLATFVSC